MWLLILAAAAIAVAILWSHTGNSASASAKSAKGGRKGAAAVTPVVAVQATRGNIGVFVSGLGAITPLKTVTVRSRVDGQLMAVHFKEGDYVTEGDPLVDIDPRPYRATLEQAQGQLARDQALLENSRVDLQRYQTLISENAIPQQQVATQESTVKQYEGTVKNDQGMVDAATLNVNFCHITSPISGIVGLRLVDPGNIVHATDANGLIVVAQDQPISAIFTISEDQLPTLLPKIRADQKLAVEAWDREMKNKLSEGEFSNIDNEIDQTTGTVKIRAVFPNSKRTLFPNQFVNARLLLQEKQNVTLLATAAIQRNTNNTYVFLIQPNNTVTIRNITIGTTEGEQSEITGGLMPGDKVVMTGVDKLQEGSKVNPTLSGEAKTTGES
ncbi:MAG TPA: MdtA/MuxA family multidrug efflux RND transporter periplasmic adaptor subunit [Bryobacteraceae bacterium]